MTIIINNQEVSLPYFCMSKDGSEFYKVTKDLTFLISHGQVHSPTKTQPHWITAELIPVLQKEVEQKHCEAMQIMKERFFGVRSPELLHEIGDGC